MEGRLPCHEEKHPFIVLAAILQHRSSTGRNVVGVISTGRCAKNCPKRCPEMPVNHPDECQGNYLNLHLNEDIQSYTIYKLKFRDDCSIEPTWNSMCTFQAFFLLVSPTS